MSVLSLGLIETRGLVAAIEAADAAAKAANITLLSAELLGGGIVTLRLQGELGAVQAAVDAGAQAAKRIGEVVAVRVIPRPVPELVALAPSTKFANAVEKTAARSGNSVKEQRVTTPAPSQPRLKPAAVAPSRKVKPVESQRKSVDVISSIKQNVVAPAQHSAPATVSRPHHNFEELEAMPVVRLRQYARSVKNLGIQGRQISMANKTQLLEAIRQAGSHH